MTIVEEKVLLAYLGSEYLDDDKDDKIIVFSNKMLELIRNYKG